MKKIILYPVLLFVINIHHINGQGQWISLVSGTSAYLTSVFFPTTDTGYISMDNGYVLKTVNGGQNWNINGAGPRAELFFLNSQIGFGTKSKYILLTKDGGSSWDTVFSNPQVSDINCIHFPNQNIGYATAWDNYNGSYLLKSGNSGESWDTIYHNSNDWINPVFFTDSFIGFIGGWLGHIYKTTNGGYSWILLTVDSINTPFINSIFFPTSDSGFAASDASVYKTVDGGNSWVNLSYPFPSILYSIFFPDANNGCVVGGNGFTSLHLYQTNNGGNTWYQGTTGVQTLVDVFFTNSSTGYAVGSNGTILKYTSPVGIGLNPGSVINTSFYSTIKNDKIIIEFPGNCVIENSQVSVFTVQGQFLQKQTVIENSTEIDLKNLPTGIYYLQVQLGDNIIVKKIIKE